MAQWRTCRRLVYGLSATHQAMHWVHTTWRLEIIWAYVLMTVLMNCCSTGVCV